MQSAQSPWRIKLVREITLILLIKLAILLGIKAIWFDAPTVPEDGLNRVAHHLLSNAGSQSPSTEETPR